MLPEVKAVGSNPCHSSHPQHPEDAGKAGTKPQGSSKARVKKGRCGCTTLVTKLGRCIFFKKQKKLLFLGLVWVWYVPHVLLLQNSLPRGISLPTSQCGALMERPLATEPNVSLAIRRTDDHGVELI